jgi:proteasome alpha subunit
LGGVNEKMFARQSGYDRAITVFSPDGRIFQVEYALETVKRGTISIGVICNEGVVLGAEESISKFQDENYSRKIFVIDENLGAVVSGYVPDGRVLIEYAREYSQHHRLLYDEIPYVEVVAKRIADIKQSFTQQGGVRPFGVAIIFAGINPDDTAEIYVTDPSGSCIKYSVAVIGAGSESALEFISKHYKDGLTLEETKILVAGAIYHVSQNKQDLKIRLLEIPKTTKKSRFIGLKESVEYVEKAREKFGLQ